MKFLFISFTYLKSKSFDNFFFIVVAEMLNFPW